MRDRVADAEWLMAPDGRAAIEGESSVREINSAVLCVTTPDRRSGR